MRDAVPVHAVTRRLSDVAAAYGTVLRNPSLRRLQIVYGTSVVAEWGFLVALSVYAYDVRGATGVGIVGVVRMVPAALATPFAAVLSDRFRRELVLLWIELGSAIAMAGAAIAYFAGPAEIIIYALAGCSRSWRRCCARPSRRFCRRSRRRRPSWSRRTPRL